MFEIDYNASAEIFGQKRSGRKGQLFYKRFSTVASALKFVVEDLSEKVTNVWLEIDEERFESVAIRKFYDSDSYPLTRMPRATAVKTAGSLTPH
ncbi:MAG: hypothetical protein JWN11_18 [Hyphomicrobiales bacterium]|nr:hypothetical protein [Hyphomicrobiales bacterium]